MASEEQPPKKNVFSGPIGWIVTLVAVAAILAVALYVRNELSVAADIKAKSQQRMDDESNKFLPRTRSIVSQKVRSLLKYNDERTEKELLEFFTSQSGKAVDAKAFEELSKQIVSEVIPLLWRRSGRDAEKPPILHQHMHRWIQIEFPHKTLTNADVVVYPDVEKLRIIVSEPNTDYFRDTAWHWKWIGQYADSEAETKVASDDHVLPVELDVYAAEELSEFLSVLAVAVVQIAARDSDASEVGANEIRNVFARMSSVHPEFEDDAGERAVDKPLLFSAEKKNALLASLPDPMFREITAQTGIDFVHRMAESNSRRRTEVLTTVGFGGGGVSINDYDGDGDQDVYFAGDQCGALFQNDNGKLKNVSQWVGLSSCEGESRAGYFIDFDNDGDNDLFITRVGLPHLLLENDGRGRFHDIAKAVGLVTQKHISHEAVWCDVDNDGNLDVYVANFGDWLSGEKPTIGRINVNAAPNELFMQRVDANGKRTFEEVSAEMGIDDRGWSHCVAGYDFDRDGWTDLFSLNDFGASKLYRNLEGKGFEEISAKMRIDNVYNAMNFTLMDLKHQGDLSIYISQIMKLVHRQRYKRPTEQTKVIFDPKIIENMRIIVANCLITQTPDYSHFNDDHNVLIEPAELGWSWGVTSYDYENDSDDDMLVANGTEPETPRFWKDSKNFIAIFQNEANVCYVQQDGYFYDVSSINPIAFKGNSRCAMTMDVDGDGDLDVFMANYDSPAQVYENLQQESNQWIRLKLVGTKSNRNAIGARVELRFAGSKRFSQVVSRSGYLSQPSYELHFGLGESPAVEELIITWPSGIVQTVKNLEAGKLHEIVEAE